MDPEGKIISWNKAAEKLFEWTQKEVVGKYNPTIPKDEISAFRKRLERQLNGKSDIQTPCRRMRKDGTLVDVCLSTAPLRGASGEIVGAMGVLTDITEKKKAKEALSAERAFLQAVIDGVLHPISVMNPEREVLLMNKAAKNLLSAGEGQNGARCYQMFYHGDSPCENRESCPAMEVLESGRPASAVHHYHAAGGEVRTFEIDASPLRRNGTVEGVIEVLRDVTERVRAEAQAKEKDERLNYLAFHDSLTHLPNRALFYDRLQHALAKARRSGKKSALLYLDLDLFKKINDSLGHQAGDRVLCEVARRIRRIVRKADTVARLGGDDFVIILEEVDGVSRITRVAQKIREVLSEVVFVGDHRLYVSASIGISLFPDDGQDVERLLRAAEMAMYRAKEEGRNGYQLYQEKMNSRAQEMLLMESHLREALEKEQLVLHYQPQVVLSTGRHVGAEALLRWEHPERGLIGPDQFIPLAEETGLIVPIGEWVIRNACRQLKRWMDRGLPPMLIAVNVSARQFRQSNIIQLVSDILLETGLPPELLELEITESTIMNDVEAAIVTMENLNSLGVKIAIDDFGTGYSSLAYLKKFPIQKLKVDRTFVRDISCDPNDAGIVSAIIAMAHTLNLEVVAEGIETLDHLQFLQKTGCEVGQGYLFSRPVPQEEFLTLIKETDGVFDAASAETC